MVANKKIVGFVLIYILIVFVTQYGSLNHEVIDWDESTFIIMAQDILRNHLPYVPLFDNKPPGMFFLLAAVMNVFGKNLTVVRLFGDFCLLFSAFAMFAVTKQFVDNIAAGLSVCVMIAAASASFGLHTSTEKPVMFLLAGILWAIIVYGDRFWSPFLVGVLLSTAVIIRTNIAYVVIAIGVIFLLGAYRPSLRLYRWSLLLYTAGGAIPLAIILLIYVFAHSIGTFMLCAVTVPLFYSSHGLSMLQVLRKMIIEVALLKFSYAFILFSALSIIGFVSLVWTMHWKSIRASNVLSSVDRNAIIVAIVFFATGLSIIKSGEAYPHYLLQLFPFLCIFTALSCKVHINGWSRLFATSICYIAIVSAIILSGPATARMLFEKPAVEAAYIVRRGAEQIAADRLPGDKVWAMDYQLILFYLNEPPISAVVAQPDNIVRPEIMVPLVKAGFVSGNEIGKIFAAMPRYIVTRNAGLAPYFRGSMPAAYAELFGRQYEVWLHYEDLYVYRYIKP